MRTWLLVHPPLLGPAVLGPLAGELRAQGADVAVPDLRGAVTTAPGWYHRFTAAAAVTGAADVVLGFSGAGVVLPAVAAAVGARRVVWLDAIVPAATGATTTSPELQEQVAGLVRDGRIAAWPTWWEDDELAAQLPDPQLRATVAAEAPELPADFYTVAVPGPADWPDGDVRYVHLSPGYDRSAAQARARGWSVTGNGAGRHLDVVTDPARIVAQLTGSAGTSADR
ncbi:hypothetical protein [Modestobacter sp. DSM 44400]|uniref:hypothetical protein n=1 Tax=Modestobacter sp. DSM 44400 TaxID=1550230 RepID=UPI000B85D25E|nr:hypothetical protein [Modestobacter sp. DSM 44400]